LRIDCFFTAGVLVLSATIALDVKRRVGLNVYRDEQ
jgi:hypothetical protein